MESIFTRPVVICFLVRSIHLSSAIVLQKNENLGTCVSCLFHPMFRVCLYYLNMPKK